MPARPGASVCYSRLCALRVEFDRRAVRTSDGSARWRSRGKCRLTTRSWILDVLGANRRRGDAHARPKTGCSVQPAPLHFLLVTSGCLVQLVPLHFLLATSVIPASACVRASPKSSRTPPLLVQATPNPGFLLRKKGWLLVFVRALATPFVLWRRQNPPVLVPAWPNRALLSVPQNRHACFRHPESRDFGAL